MYSRTFNRLPEQQCYIQVEHEQNICEQRMSHYNDLQNFKHNFTLIYKKTVDCSQSTAKNVIELLDLAGSFNEEYLKKVDARVKFALNLFNKNTNDRQYRKKYFEYFLQAILQEKFFNRNGKERWEVDIQEFVTQENLKKIIDLLKNMPEFIETKQLPLRAKNIVVLGASLNNMIGRMRFVVLNSPKNMVVLTSDRPVFSNKNIKIINKSNSYREIDCELNPEQRLLLKYYKKNFPHSIFLKHLNKKFFTEDYMAKISKKILQQKWRGINIISIKTIESKKTTETNGRRRANTVDTVFEYIDNANNVFHPIFISNQPHITSQYSQIKAIFNPKNFHGLKKEIAMDGDGNYIYRGYNIKNYKQFYKNFRILAFYGFDVVGNGIEDVINIDYNNSSKEKKDLLLNNVKLILQNIAGSFNSYQTEKMNKIENDILKSKNIF